MGVLTLGRTAEPRSLFVFTPNERRGRIKGGVKAGVRTTEVGNGHYETLFRANRRA